jgi:hypothetical protein
MTAFVASGIDPTERINQLQHAVDVLSVNPDELLGELRFRLNVIERAPSLTVAQLHRECVCHIVLMLDRYVTLGGRLPHPWHHAGGRR